MTLENLLKVLKLDFLHTVFIWNTGGNNREYTLVSKNEIISDLRKNSLLNEEVLEVRIDINDENKIVIFIRI